MLFRHPPHAAPLVTPDPEPDEARDRRAIPADVPRRLLVVDDEPVIRSALARFFTRRGWQVDEAADGEVARECLLGGSDPVPYDAVISDMRMPRLSGERLHDALQRERPQLLDRCIFSTGDVGSPDAAEFIERTHCRVIAKPFELRELADMITALPHRQDG